MRKLLVLVLFLASSTAMASHIVGGEFELLHLDYYRYKLNLILYFDVNNGNPGARDPDATVRIFRKRDNVPVMDVYIPFYQQFRVDYFQPSCSSGEIVTDKLIYSTNITLSPELFNDPEGYYISWERCCRNYTITNIFSQDPESGGSLSAGQTFYLEFPPVVKNNQPFVNSSPQLFPPLNDYACPNRPYWVDFAGIDVDNDSLVYSLVTPLNTVTVQAIPAGGPHAGPYPSVIWRPGFSIDNIMGGLPDLKISNNGFLTVTPTRQGLFVFAVKCEEYRDGEKIGEVIRDFQMLVLDICPVADPPKIKGKRITDTNFGYVDNMSVTFLNTVSDEQRCIEVQVSDPDSSKPEDNFSENVWLHVIPIGFKTTEDLKEILPEVSSVKLSNGSVESFELCFSPCPLKDGPYTLGIIAFDDACALPLSDTLRVTVNIEAPYNTPAYFVTSDVDVTLKEGDDYHLPILGKDDEQNPLIIDVITDGFALADFGMSINNASNANGVYTADFDWATGCDIYDFTQRTSFSLKVVINDDEFCDAGDPDTLSLVLKVILPLNTDPVISTDLIQTTILNRIKNPIAFNVFGVDSDGDELELLAVGTDFEFVDHEINFSGAEGISQVQSPFSWLPSCTNVNLDEQREFNFIFLLNDKDKCKFPNYDSLEVKITILPPDNSSPKFRFVNLNDKVIFEDRTANLNVGDLLKVEVIAEDAEDNEVRLKLLEPQKLPLNVRFDSVRARGVARSILAWDVECENLAERAQPSTYSLNFTAGDDACFNDMIDTINVVVNVADVKDKEVEFLPANIFTPNKDGVNDFYELPDLPIDKCSGRFLSFRVFNRWGTEVFVTIEREFKWDAKGLEPGVYYYVVEFSDREYNGPLTILY